MNLQCTTWHSWKITASQSCDTCLAVLRLGWRSKLRDLSGVPRPRQERFAIPYCISTQVRQYGRYRKYYRVRTDDIRVYDDFKASSKSENGSSSSVPLAILPDPQLVYLYCHTIFINKNARLLNFPDVLRLVRRHSGPLRPLIERYSYSAIALIVQKLQEHNVFADQSKAKAMFPDLFKTSAKDKAARDASDAEILQHEEAMAKDASERSDDSENVAPTAVSNGTNGNRDKRLRSLSYDPDARMHSQSIAFGKADGSKSSPKLDSKPQDHYKIGQESGRSKNVRSNGYGRSVHELEHP